MDVSIIIPVFKRTEWIGKCIEKLKNQDFSGTFEILMVDDGSPNSLDIQKEIDTALGKNKNFVRYVRNKHKGPAATRNFGISFSAGKILCFLDDDSMPDKHWLKEITSPFQNSKKIGLVNGSTLSLNRDLALPVLLEKAVYWGKSFATCNIAYRRDVLEALKGFDEMFTEPSWEDNELGLRAESAGYIHFYNEKAIVYHPHEDSPAEYKNKCILNGRGTAIFTRKYLFKKPLWGICAPFIMSARIAFGIFPSAWIKKYNSIYYLKFIWAVYSIQGFFMAIIGKKHAKD